MSETKKRYFTIYAGDGPVYWTVAVDTANALRNVAGAMVSDGMTDEIDELSVKEMSEAEAKTRGVVDDMLPAHMNGNMTMLDLNDVLCSEYP
jgi:hypothetical protein